MIFPFKYILFLFIISNRTQLTFWIAQTYKWKKKKGIWLQYWIKDSQNDGFILKEMMVTPKLIGKRNKKLS